MTRRAPSSMLFPYTTLFRSFTGIVQGVATIVEVIKAPGLNTLVVRFPEAKVQGVTIGASVAINGTCLTVTRQDRDRKSTRLNSSHVRISYAVSCLKKKKNTT